MRRNHTFRADQQRRGALSRAMAVMEVSANAGRINLASNAHVADEQFADLNETIVNLPPSNGGGAIDGGGPAER